MWPICGPHTNWPESADFSRLSKLHIILQGFALSVILFREIGIFYSQFTRVFVPSSIYIRFHMVIIEDEKSYFSKNSTYICTTKHVRAILFRVLLIFFKKMHDFMRQVGQTCKNDNLY